MIYIFAYIVLTISSFCGVDNFFKFFNKLDKPQILNYIRKKIKFLFVCYSPNVKVIYG